VLYDAVVLIVLSQKVVVDCLKNQIVSKIHASEEGCDESRSNGGNPLTDHCQFGILQHGPGSSWDTECDSIN
jgi:hypothetical protein